MKRRELKYHEKVKLNSVTIGQISHEATTGAHSASHGPSSSLKRGEAKKSGALIGKRASMIMNFREKQHLFKSGLVKQS